MNNDEMVQRLETAATTLAKDEADFLLEEKHASAQQAADALVDVVGVVAALKEQNRGNPSLLETSQDAGAADEESSSPLLFMAYGDVGEEDPEPIGLFARRIDADRALKKVEPLFVGTHYWPFTPDASYEAWLRDTCEDRFGENLFGLLQHPEDYPNARPTEEWRRIMHEDEMLDHPSDRMNWKHGLERTQPRIPTHAEDRPITSDAQRTSDDVTVTVTEERRYPKWKYRLTNNNGESIELAEPEHILAVAKRLDPEDFRSLPQNLEFEHAYGVVLPAAAARERTLKLDSWPPRMPPA